jgi:D-beta-D-heptose 7-phosphate kinase/D-beta-D-heptose 1-phosphate adenosyltransferase
VERLLAADPRISSRLLRIGGRLTTVKTRYVAGAQQLLRLDEETKDPIGAAAIDTLMRRFGEELKDADIVVVSDYAKGVLADTVLREIMAGALAAGHLIIADPKRPDFRAYRGATIITPNLQELRTGTQSEVLTDDDVELAGRQVLDLTEGESVIVTRGEKGLTLVPRNGRAIHLPTKAREIADISGAGDTIVATLASALSVGGSLLAGAALANIAAGIAVGKQGTASVSDMELASALQFRAVELAQDKVLSMENAVLRVEKWHRGGRRVGFANGCFDLIHPGHIQLLSEARSHCDSLVVALNSDSSTKRLKGPTRPIQSESARATVIASLSTVDLVVVFSEDTPLELIGKLRPDVLVKGSDYRANEIVGADLVRGWGGDVVIVPLEETYSTTNTVKRIADFSGE